MNTRAFLVTNHCLFKFLCNPKIFVISLVTAASVYVACLSPAANYLRALTDSDFTVFLHQPIVSHSFVNETVYLNSLITASTFGHFTVSVYFLFPLWSV